MSDTTVPQDDELIDWRQRETERRQAAKEFGEWLGGLKVGDEVALVGSGVYGKTTIVTIDRTTPTQIIIGNSIFRRNDGRRRGGGSWDSSSIKQPTEEQREKAYREYAMSTLDTYVRVYTEFLTNDELRSILPRFENAKKRREAAILSRKTTK